MDATMFTLRTILMLCIFTIVLQGTLAVNETTAAATESASSEPETSAEPESTAEGDDADAEGTTKNKASLLGTLYLPYFFAMFALVKKIGY